MGIEERKAPRVSARLTTFVKYASGKVRRALTQDVSAGGARLITDEPLEAGQQVELEIKLPDFDQPVVCTAEVVQSQPLDTRKGHETSAETRVKIVSMSDKHKAMLLQYAAMNMLPPDAGV
jgi:hypothetical protein